MRAPMVAPAWTPPPRLAEYRLIRQLGRGGMGQVWLAIDELLERQVAIKLVDSLVPDPAQRRRFLVEARAAARLMHPNVVSIHRVAEIDGIPYIVSEWVRGEPLDKLPRPLPWRRVVELGIGLARGLAAAHQAGVLHRDLKPANAIVSDDGTVKILDFGLAKLDGDTPVATDLVPPRAATIASNNDGTETMSFVADDGGPANMAVAGMTRHGAVLGTPFYMAPESWRGEAHTRRSDVYSLGALLFELAAGTPPFADVALAELSTVVPEHDAPAVASRAPDVDAALAAVIDRCLARDPRARFDSASDVRAALEAIAAPASSRAIVTGNPYRGLARFDTEHAALFFGRRDETAAVVDRLRAGRLVVIAGDSGVGKSSLVRAGVLPAIAAGAIGTTRRWRTAVCSPGRRPCAAIAEALASACGTTAETVALADAAESLRAVLAAAGGDGVLLVIDQLEELVTRADPAEAAIAARWIAEVAAGAGPLAVLATVRGDLVTRVASLPGLGTEVPRALQVLAPLDDVGLRAAIVEPAEAASVGFESPELVDDLVTAGRAEGGLPLLEFALAALWENRDRTRSVITRAALDALGGVIGALSRHADGVIAALPAVERAAARRILLALVAAEGVSAGRTESELGGDDARTALDALIAGRLVVARATPDGVIYDLAHERLATSWPTLRDWLDEGVGRRAVRERLVRAAAEWQRLGGAAAGLWRDRRLDEARRLPGDELGPTERAFVAASSASRRRRRLALAAASVAVPALALGVWGWSRHAAERTVEQRVDARVAEARTRFERARSERDTLETARTAAWAQFDSGDQAGGDAAWANVLARASAVDVAWSDAANAAEAALLVDATRTDARTLLADALVERALLAERDHRATDVAEILARLALHDTGGTRAARWQSPGHVELAVTPATATIEVERFVDGDEPRWEQLANGAAPWTLPPGSYRVIAHAPEHADTTLPFLVERGAHLSLRLQLPRASTIAPGFVYVPAGAYLTGVVADESQRTGFFRAAPLHPSTTGAYLIARHETTWREWIEFLDALSPAERAKHLPVSAGSGARAGVANGVELRATPAGWEIHLSPTGTPLVARAGQRVRYPHRTHRAEQDWLAMPVTGVSAVDARAYAAWRASRGLRGARLCSESEWERAARGADGRMFPGGQHLGLDDANHQDTYGTETAARGPDEVGSHPASASPFGVHDLAGNAFELVAGTSPDLQYVRGGAYAFQAIAARIELHEQFEPAMRDVAVGLRICADVAN
ncbi:MAG: protein kinase [Kofleriaceae bacterium]|nr:protein kinase [Kofleriaceae bacterium]